MSTTSSVSSAAGADQIIQELINRADSNKDGKITTDEFGAFLKSVLAGLSSGEQPSAPTLATADATTDASGDAVEASPSTWSDNNAPYGVTFAGFSPQDHRDLTLNDLGVPGKAEKYAAYSYLLANKIQPTSDWAPKVAEALNAKYNTTVFHAIDGETLGYGNEYIHSAANGYGMASGTYNQNSTGEFFWGWV